MCGFVLVYWEGCLAFLRKAFGVCFDLLYEVLSLLYWNIRVIVVIAIRIRKRVVWLCPLHHFGAQFLYFGEVADIEIDFSIDEATVGDELTPQIPHKLTPLNLSIPLLPAHQLIFHLPCILPQVLNILLIVSGLSFVFFDVWVLGDENMGWQE